MILKTIDDLYLYNLCKNNNVCETDPVNCMRYVFLILEKEYCNKIKEAFVTNNILNTVTDINDIEEVMNKCKTKNVYTVVWYVLFSKINENEVVIYEDVIRYIMNCESKYSVKHNFVKKVIREPLEEVNKTNIRVKEFNIKKGKKVIGYKFKISKEMEK